MRAGSGVDSNSEENISESLPNELTEDLVRSGATEELDGSAKDKNWESGREIELEALDLKDGDTGSREATGIRDWDVLCVGEDTGFGEDDGELRADSKNRRFISSIASSVA